VNKRDVKKFQLCNFYTRDFHDFCLCEKAPEASIFYLLRICLLKRIFCKVLYNLSGKFLQIGFAQYSVTHIWMAVVIIKLKAFV